MQAIRRLSVICHLICVFPECGYKMVDQLTVGNLRGEECTFFWIWPSASVYDSVHAQDLCGLNEISGMQCILATIHEHFIIYLMGLEMRGRAY